MDRERTDLSTGVVHQSRERALTLPSFLRIGALADRLRSSEVRIIAALLLLALVRGLVYIVIVPPWTHYDEPTHFEYAALINVLGHRPQPGEVDRDLRFAIARSVAIHAPWRIPQIPIDTGQAQLPDIGVEQVSHPSLYYMLASVPLRFTTGLPIEMQLYTMRAFSLLLYLVGIAIAAWIIRLALPESPELRLAALGLIIFVPPYTRLMSAASNDSLLTLVGILLLLIAITIVQQGWSWRSVLLLVVGFLLPFVTKRTIFVLSLVPLFAGLLVASPRSRRWIGIGVAAMLVVGLGFLLSMPRGSSYWLEVSTGRLAQPSALGAHSGQHSLVLSGANPQDSAGIGQLLSPTGLFDLNKKPLTVGVWARSLSGKIEVIPPSLVGVQSEQASPVTVGEEWQFIHHTVRMPKSYSEVELRLNPPVTAGSVLYDDVIAIPGDYSSVNALPSTRPDGRIDWNDNVETNLLNNDSAETLMPIVHLPTLVQTRIQSALPFGTLDLFLSSLSDWKFIAATYPAGILFLFKTFWLIVDGGFSAAAIERWTWLMLLLAGLSIAGWVVLGVRRYRQRADRPETQCTEMLQSRRIVWLCWAAASVSWAIGIIRVHLQPPWPSPDYTYPIGRYVYAAFVPTVLLLIIGIGTLAPRRLRLWLCVGLVALFFCYDLLALANNIWYSYVAQ